MTLAFEVYLYIVVGINLVRGEIADTCETSTAVSLLHPRSIAFHCIYKRQHLYFYHADTANRSLSEN